MRTPWSNSAPWPPKSDLELIEEGKRWLREYDVTRSANPPSERTLAEYAKAVRRMRDRRLLPERAAGTKRSFYYLRASVLALAAIRLRECLPKLEAASGQAPTDEAKAAWAKSIEALRGPVGTMRRYPPGESGYFMKGDRKCAWDPSMTAETVRTRRRTNDVEAVQAALPDGWMETLWRVVSTSRTKYIDAIAVELALGCRREELLKGVRVATDGQRLRIIVRGAKTDRDHGRRLRVVAIDRAVHPWHDHLIRSAVAEGSRKGGVHVFEIRIGNVKTYTNAFSSLADKCRFWMPYLWTAASAEPQPVRAALAVLLATGWTPKKVSKGAVVEAVGDDVVVRPLHGRGGSHVVAAPIQPWETYLAELAAMGAAEVRAWDADAFTAKVKALKAATPVASITPYVSRHAVSASRKLETRLSPQEVAAMTPAERDAYESRRREEVARTLGHASVKTQGRYGAPWASKGSTGITAARGVARDRKPAEPKPGAKPEA
jgi:integrase